MIVTESCAVDAQRSDHLDTNPVTSLLDGKPSGSWGTIVTG